MKEMKHEEEEEDKNTIFLDDFREVRYDSWDDVIREVNRLGVGFIEKGGELFEVSIE